VLVLPLRSELGLSLVLLILAAACSEKSERPAAGSTPNLETPPPDLLPAQTPALGSQLRVAVRQGATLPLDDRCSRFVPIMVPASAAGVPARSSACLVDSSLLGRHEFLVDGAGVHYLSSVLVLLYARREPPVQPVPLFCSDIANDLAGERDDPSQAPLVAACYVEPSLAPPIERAGVWAPLPAGPDSAALMDSPCWLLGWRQAEEPSVPVEPIRCTLDRSPP
jgi:hypothetical protein